MIPYSEDLIWLSIYFLNKKVSFKIIRLTRLFTSYQFKNTQIFDRVENDNNFNKKYSDTAKITEA